MTSLEYFKSMIDNSTSYTGKQIREAIDNVLADAVYDNDISESMIKAFYYKFLSGNYDISNRTNHYILGIKEFRNENGKLIKKYIVVQKGTKRHY